MDNDKPLTLSQTDHHGRKFQFNLKDQTWSGSVFDQTFEGKSLEEVREKVDAARRKGEEKARSLTEYPPLSEEYKEKIETPAYMAGYKLAFRADKETGLIRAEILFHKKNTRAKDWSEREKQLLVNENGEPVPGEAISVYQVLGAQRNFSKPKIKALSQGFADRKYFKDLDKEIMRWGEQIVEKCGGTLTVQHQQGKSTDKEQSFLELDGGRYSDPQWNVIPYEKVELSQWKQKGDNIVHENGSKIQIYTSTSGSPAFVVKIPKKMVGSSQSYFQFDDAAKAMAFVQTLTVALDKAPTLTGHEIAYMNVERYLYDRETDKPMPHFTVLGLVGKDADAMIVKADDGKLELFSTPTAYQARKILTKHLDEAEKPIQLIKDVVNEIREKYKKTPQLRNTEADRGLVDQQDKESLEAQFKKLKALAEEFNTQIEEASKQNSISLDKKRANFKKVLDKIGGDKAKPRSPKA